jgi:hypothetical protein
MTQAPLRDALILTTARALIEKPERWTRNAYRRDAKGDLCGQEFAVCWCATGALSQASRQLGVTGDWNSAYDLLAAAVGGKSVEEWNDARSRTHDQILEGFDKAIALAGAPR